MENITPEQNNLQGNIEPLKEINHLNKTKKWPLVFMLIILIISISAIGSLAYQNYLLRQNLKKSIIEDTYISNLSPTPTNPVAEIKELPDYSNLTANWSLHSISKDKHLSFKLPPDWKNLEFWEPMPPNAYGIQSPDFKSEHGFGNISKGSIIDVTIHLDKYSPSSGFSKMTIDEEGESQGSLGVSKILAHFKVAGLDAVKYIYHGGGENQNTVEGIIFRKGENGYAIEQNYHLNSPNPYPELLEQVASTITFSD